MTCFDPDPARSTFELPFEAATARMAALQGETDQTRSAGIQAGPLHGIRSAIGRGLITLGSVIEPTAAASSPTTGPRTVVSR